VAWCSLVLAAAMAGCGVAPTDDFSDLNGLDEKADAFSKKLKLEGSLDYGQTSKSVKYVYPHYVAWKFAGQPGDLASAHVTSTDGSPVVWIVDNTFHVLNREDATGHSVTNDAKLTANTNPDIHTYYVIVRDANLADSHFQVELSKKIDPMFACNADSDCVAVYEEKCCPNGVKIALHSGYEAQYKHDNKCTQPPHVCPLAVINDTRVAVCQANQCAMVQPAQTCGGIAGLTCPTGQYCKYDTSVCDPAHGGADCGGTCSVCVQNVLCMVTAHFDHDQCKCVPNVNGCSTNADCGAGRYCSFCWGSMQCIPNGAMC
jgi:hypothetical protein